MDVRETRSAPEDELGDDVEDGLTLLSGRMLCCQENSADLRANMGF